MRVPILYCLSHPDRTSFEFQPFDPLRFAQLNFEPIDTKRFPAVPLAYETLQRGGTAGAVLNAADEVMTGRFLKGEVNFPDITRIVTDVVRNTTPTGIENLNQVLAADQTAREATLSLTPPS